MNDTEKRAFTWLMKKGYTDVTFYRSSSPDFVTKSGEKFEVKKIRNNVIWFSPKQIEQLGKMGDVKIIVMDDGTEPIAVFPFSEIKDGFWHEIKIAGGNYNPMVNIWIDSELWKQAKIQAVMEGKTLQQYIEELLQSRIVKK